ncbi:Protein SlyX [Thalassocella blandensis]|nr:Protein SlyX [Thalassocella blandensis]
MDKVEDLETRMAFQEDLIETLSKQIAEQQRDITMLQVQLQHLHGKFKHLSEEFESQGQMDDKPPPHY